MGYEGFIALALQSSPLLPKGEDVMGMDVPDCLRDLSQADMWLHVGLLYLSPFRPTFQKLKPMRMTGDMVAEKAVLRATGVFSTLHKTFEDIAFDRVWWARPVVLVDSVRPVVEVDAGLV